MLLPTVVFLLTLLHVAFACQPPMGAYGPNSNLPYGGQFSQDSLSQPQQQQHRQKQPSVSSLFQSPLYSGVSASANSLDPRPYGDSFPERTPEQPMNPFGDAEGSAVDCSNGIRSSLEFLGCTEISEFTDSGEGGDAGSVFCNFRKGERCRFHNSPFEKLAFRRAKFRSSGEKFEKTFREMVRRADGLLPKGAFLFVGEPFGKPREYQAAVEAKIECQKKDGTLRFRQWKTSENITLRVCTRDSEIRSCTEAINYDYEEVQVNVVNPEKFPFFVEILVSGFTSPSLFAIDDLQYEAEFCGEASRLQIDGNAIPAAAHGNPTFQSSYPIEKEKSLVAVKIQPQPITDPGSFQISFQESQLNEEESLPIHKLSTCDLLACDFSHDLCNYRNGKANLFGTKFAEWKVSNGERVGNFLTGIRTNETSSESYAYVGTDNAHDAIKGRRVYVLESPSLPGIANSTLLFDVYRRARAISLQVCLDRITNCPYEIPQIDKRIFWRKNESIALNGARKVFFVATQWQKFKWLAIANVRVLPSSSCHI